MRHVLTATPWLRQVTLQGHLDLLPQQTTILVRLAARLFGVVGDYGGGRPGPRSDVLPATGLRVVDRSG